MAAVFKDIETQGPLPCRSASATHWWRGCWTAWMRRLTMLPYRVIGEVIDILAVAHQKRRPGYWRKR